MRNFKKYAMDSREVDRQSQIAGQTCRSPRNTDFDPMPEEINFTSGFLLP
jgi:hypothetical protein